MRLGIVVTHPIQYQAPLYRHLAACTDVQPHVFFLTEHGVDSSYDPGFRRSIQYDVPLLEGYSYQFVPNRSPRPSPSTPFGAINPSLPSRVRAAGIDALLVHGYSSPSHWLAYAAAGRWRIPYILRGESRPDPPTTPGLKVAIKRAFVGPLVRRASACLAIGTENRNFYLAYGAAPERIFAAPYSVDRDRFAAAGEEGRRRRGELLGGLGLDPGRPTILFAAKLQPWKRPLDLVAAMDQIAGRANLLLIGDGPLRPAVDHLCADRAWMRSLGFVNQREIGRWYGVADLFVLPSEREPWGLAVNEAMSAGAVPIVSDAVGCGPDLVAPGAGWVFSAGDVGSLADAIVQALEPGALTSRQEVARRVAAEHGIDRTADGIVAATRAVLDL